MIFFAAGPGRGRRSSPFLAAFVLTLAASGGFAGGPACAAGATVDPAALLEQGALEEKVMGAPTAPVTVVEYASMTCGHCARFHADTFPRFKAEYVDTGKVRYVMRSLPTDPRAEAGLMLAYCAGDRYFAVSDLLYRRQADWAWAPDAGAALLKIARMAGFSQESFEACLTDRQLLDDVRSMRDRGLEQFGITAAPTFFINGVKHTGAMSIEEMSAIIDDMR